ncbi:MAG: class I adenylate-forming enzyme family protein [Pseudonocardiaceae bacterium]
MRTINPSTLFEDAAERGATLVHLDRPFDIAPDGGVTYGVEQVAELVNDAAGWLTAAGARPGDRVAIVKGNNWDTDVLAYAAVRIGAVPAKIRNNLAPEVIQVLLQRLDATVLVTTAATLETAGSAGVDLTVSATTTLSIDGPAPGAMSLDSVRGHRPPPPHRRSDDEPLVVCATSGTTGIPKLALHSTTTIIRQLAQFEARRWPVIGGRPDDTVANASAFSHGRTFCWTAAVLTMAPRHVVIVAADDPAHAEPILRAHPPTILEGLPTTFIRWQPMAAKPDNPFSDVRLYISTYDAIHPPAVRTFLAASRRPRAMFMHGWGQSETGPLTFRLFTRRALITRGDRHPTTRNQGLPTPGKVRLRVVDRKTFRTLPPGQPGVIMARTKARCLGYLGEQQRWDEKVDGPWFNTGDIGIRTRTGSVVFLDREVDEIPGMSCVELEDVIDDRLGEVLECVVLGTPGRPPLPIVVTSDGHLDEAAWQAAVRDLPPLAEPVIVTWDAVPRTGTGKVRRLALREQLAGVGATYGTGRWT